MHKQDCFSFSFRDDRLPAPRKKDSSMDGSGDAQGQNDISENFFASGQVAIDGNV